MKFLGLLTLVFTSFNSFANPSIPWRAAVKCDGSSGSAVLDTFTFSAHGHDVQLNQFVVRSRDINEYLASRNLLTEEIARNYPNETVIPVMKLPEDTSSLPAVLQTDIGNLTYRLDIGLPEIKLSIFSKLTRGEIGNWIFRECKSLQ